MNFFARFSSRLCENGPIRPRRPIVAGPGVDQLKLVARSMKQLFVEPFSDVMAALQHVMGTAKPFRPTCIMLASLLVSWFIYVPIHELLHVVGCVVPGGCGGACGNPVSRIDGRV